MTDPRVDPETGALRYRMRVPGTAIRRAAGVALCGLVAALILWAVWSWTPFNLRADLDRLETRVGLLERWHELEQKQGDLQDEIERRQGAGVFHEAPEREL
jgi:hypothetical protein